MPARSDLPTERWLDHLYAVAQGEAPWTGLAGNLAQALGADSGMVRVDTADGAIQVLDDTPNFALCHQQPELAQHWHLRDEWARRAQSRPPAQVLLTSDLMPTAQLLRSAFHANWLRPLGIFHCVGSALPLDDGSRVVVGLHRPRLAPDFDGGDVRRLQRLVPHLRRALNLQRHWQELRHWSRVQATALDRSGPAVLVTNRNGLLRHANAAGEALLRLRDPLVLHAGEVRTRSLRWCQRLSDRIRAAADAAGPHAQDTPAWLLPDPGGQRPVTLSILPLPAFHPWGGEARVMLLLHAPGLLGPSSAERARIVQASHGLTPRETELLTLLDQGRSLREAAAAMNISEGHARQRLKALFVKLGLSSQSQLLAWLARVG